MNADIIRRIQRLEARRRILSGPVDELSASLWELGEELAALDDKGIAAAAKALGISIEGVRQIMNDCKRKG